MARTIDKNLTENYPGLTKLELDKSYEAIQTYPHEGAVLNIEINNYIRYKDLPKNVQDIIDDAVEFFGNEYHEELYEVTEQEFPIVPFAIGTGSDGYHYVMIPYNVDGSEAISVDCKPQKYLDIRL